MKVFAMRLVQVTLLSAAIFVPALASAHVVVTPAKVDVGQELVFNISVPNEQSTPVTDLKLTIPSGVTDVSPTVVPGWTIQTTKTGDDISGIEWTGGTIPVGQRMDFSFGATAPANATTLDWIAYQTYADGTVVTWDQTPAGSDDATGNKGPYSRTMVINDLAATSKPLNTRDNWALGFGIAGTVLGLIGITTRRRRG